jgi:hypothetical protein
MDFVGNRDPRVPLEKAEAYDLGIAAVGVDRVKKA